MKENMKLRKLNQEELTVIIASGFLWNASNGKYGEQVDLSYTDLTGLKIKKSFRYAGALKGANFKGANLSRFDFSHENLSKVNFEEADLRCANFYHSRLSDVNFKNADLRYAKLSFADCNYVKFDNVDLRNAKLNFTDCNYYVKFDNADLRGANCCCAIVSKDTNITNVIIDDTTKYLNDQCPRTGSFIGYKKARGLSSSNYNQEYVIELEILEEAKRSSATTKKCRCSKAKVLSITNLDGTPARVKNVKSRHDFKFIYKVGEIVEVPDFDEKWWCECTTGIHFFMNREDAVNYHFG